MASLPKPPDRRQGRHRTDFGVVSHVSAGPLPSAPSGLLVATQRAWDAMWSSSLAATWQPETDLPALVRLIQLVDEAERFRRAGRKSPLVEGSQGQPVVNPLLKQRDALLSEIRQLEDRFGLSPAARLKLGVVFADAHRSIEQLNAQIVEAAADDDDPRLSGGFDDAA